MIVNYSTSNCLVLIISLLTGLTSICAQLQPRFLRGSRIERGDETLSIISSRGFRAEVYNVLVGKYTIGLYRIVNPLANQKTLYKYPVLQSHGVLFNAANMITNSNLTRPRAPIIGNLSIHHGGLDVEDSSLPFLLSNNNFDVWLCDARGSDDERSQHDMHRLNLSPNEYWNFNLDNEAHEDIPTAIDFVLAKTNSQKVIYFGYSESTTFMFMLMPDKPEIVSKIAVFVAIAPVAYMTHLKGISLGLLFSSYVPESVHLNALPAPIQLATDTSIASLCAIEIMNPISCKAIIDLIGGPGSSDFAPGFFRRFFKPTSLHAFREFVQIYRSQVFQHYDYGKDTNMAVYNSPKPPPYDLKKIPVEKLILARGGNDFLSTPQDQERLLKELSGKPYADIFVPEYNHFDFVYGKDIIKKVTEPVARALFDYLRLTEQTLIKDINQFDNIEMIPDEVKEPSTTLSSSSRNSLGTQTTNFLENLITAPVDFLKTLTFGRLP